MEALMVNTIMDFEFYCYSNSTTPNTTPTTTTTTTTTTSSTTSDDNGGCTWNDWSPVVDWDELSRGNDDFHELIDSMIDETDNVVHHHHHHAMSTPEGRSYATSPSESMMMMDVEDDVVVGDTKGLRLVHLLMAAAEALTGVNKSRELARVILVRLKELVSPNEGTNMERLSAYFTEALQGLLDGNGGGGINGKHWSSINGPHYKDDLSQSDIVAAFQLLQDMSPYVKFGHFTANQAILEAVANERRVHIVDYDIMEGIQWPSLMQDLVSRKDGQPTPHLRITALSRGGGSGGRRSFGTMQETGRRLTAYAASIGQPFSFHQCRLDSDETFKPSTLKLVRGEALIINCMLHLPHFNYRSPESTLSFLTGAKTLNPKLVTLVEEEVGPSSEGGFMGKFMDSLHRYSSMYDSLEAGFPMQSRARALVERVFIGPRITGSIARVYRANGEEEGSSWSEWLASSGFQPNAVSFANNCQAKLLLGLFNDGYGVEELASNKLVLGWKSLRLLSASIWTSCDNDQL